MFTFSGSLRFLTILAIGLSLSLTSCDDDDGNSASPSGTDNNLTLSLKTSPGTLIESEETEAKLTFELDEAPPKDGIEVPLSVAASDGSNKPLAQFKITSFNAEEDIEGGSLAEQPDQSTLNSLTLLIEQKTATMTLTKNDDEFDSGPLDVIFTVLESDGYEINPDFKKGTFTIVEEANEDTPLTLSLKTSPDTLIEVEEMEATLTFELNKKPPQEGIEVPLSVVASDGSNKPLAQFKITSFNAEEDIEGGSLAEQPDPSTLNSLTLLIEQQTATMTLTKNDDEFDSGPLDVIFTVMESDGYEINADFKKGAFTIVEE